MKPTFAVVLDYNGGAGTDRLVQQLHRVNKRIPIHVLDNGSDPDKRSRYITHETGKNLGIGGGLNRCVELASQEGAGRLCFIANDVQLPDGAFPIQLLEYPFAFEDTVAVSAAFTPGSTQSWMYPWMMQRRDKYPYRAVPHVDFLFAMLDLDFLDEIGGFPQDSFWGRGFDLHFALQARNRNRKMYILDETVISHTRESSRSQLESTTFHRFEEMAKAFIPYYGVDGWMEFVPPHIRPKYEIMRQGLELIEQGYIYI